MLPVLVEDDLEALAELFDVPRVVFAWVVAGEVGRGSICDGLCVDADDLLVEARKKSVDQAWEFGRPMCTHLPAIKLLLSWDYYWRHVCCRMFRRPSSLGGRKNFEARFEIPKSELEVLR